MSKIRELRAGDKVLVKSVKDCIGKSPFVGGEMNKYCGKVCTVRKVERSERDGYQTFYLKEDHDGFIWSTNLVTPFKYQPGEAVKVRGDLKYGNYHMKNDASNAMYPADQQFAKRGKIVKIKSITKTGKYMIEGSIFPWVDEMFEDAVEVDKVEKTTGRKLKVGDRVMLKCDVCYARAGMTGTIKKFNSSNVSVEFDMEFSGGHNCDGATKHGYGHYICLKDLAPLKLRDSKKYLICAVSFEKGEQLYSYLTEDTTITVGSKVAVKVGNATRETTATVERIGYYTESESPYPVEKMKSIIHKGEAVNLYNGEVVCVSKTKNHYAYTPGKIYKAVDGQIKIDNGFHQPYGSLVYSVDELNEKLKDYAQFIEVKR